MVLCVWVKLGNELHSSLTLFRSASITHTFWRRPLSNMLTNSGRNSEVDRMPDRPQSRGHCGQAVGRALCEQCGLLVTRGTPSLSAPSALLPNAKQGKVSRLDLVTPGTAGEADWMVRCSSAPLEQWDRELRDPGTGWAMMTLVEEKVQRNTAKC